MQDLPELDSLACFVAAARTLNFRAAARQRGLTPAALGKHIKRLEEQLAVSLFHRTTRRVALSDAGAALFPHASKILEDALACASVAARREGPRPLELVLGTRYELGMSWIIPVRRALRRELPHVTIHLYFGSGLELERRLLGCDVDCVVSSRAPSTRRVEALPLHREEYLLVAAPELAAATPFTSPSDAGRHTLIDLHDDLPLFRYWRPDTESGAPPHFARLLRVGTIAASRALVLDGEGVAMLPEYFVRRDLREGTLTRLLPEAPIAHDMFRLLYRADDPRRSTFGAMATHMRQTPVGDA